MMLSIVKKTNTWLEVLKYLVDNIGCAKKGHSGFYFEDVYLEDFDLTLDPFTACCYTNRKGKLATLRKQYLNQDSLNQVFSDKVVEVSMVGGPKWGSTAGNKHCMKSLVVDHSQKTVRINFRNSDFLKKFLVDIYFVKEILAEVGIKDYTYSCKFDQLTLRTPFVYLFLHQVFVSSSKERFGSPEVASYLESDNPLIVDFIKYYRGLKNKSVNFKSLERAQRRMKELSVYKIIERYL